MVAVDRGLQLEEMREAQVTTDVLFELLDFDRSRNKDPKNDDNLKNDKILVQKI